MIKKLSFCMLTALLVQSCAGIKHSSLRAPSQESDLCTSAFKNIDLDSEKILSLEHSKLAVERLNNCTKEVGVDLDSHDRLMFFKAAGPGVLIKTLHGKLLFLKDKNLSLVDVKFPVASFNIENDQVTLYNANDKGRFCTSQVIESHLMSSEPSCKIAADKIDIKDL